MGFGVFEAGAGRETNVEYVTIIVTKTEKLKESMLNKYQKEVQRSKAWEKEKKMNMQRPTKYY